MKTSQQWLAAIVAVVVAAGCGESARTSAGPTSPLSRSGAAAFPLMTDGPAAADSALRSGDAEALQPARALLAAPVSSATLTALATRAELDARTVLETESFAGYATGPLASPVTIHGVTYTTPNNVILGPGIGFGIVAPVICYNSWTPMKGSIGGGAAHYTLFGFDLQMINRLDPATITLTTNKGTYLFPGMTAGGPASPTFFGFALTQPDEYFTGFSIASKGAGSAPCLRNVSVGMAQPADGTPPVVTPAITGTQGTGGWYTSAVAISWAVSDAESAVSGSTGCDAVSLWENTAERSYTCTATSAGGTATQTVTVKIDRTIPTLSGAVTSGTLGGEGWYLTDVGVTWTTSDPGPSGLVRSADCAAASLATDSPAHAFHCTVTTGAGIGSGEGTVTVKRDATRPVVAFTGNAGSYTVDQQVSIGCEATDNLSGIATSSCAPMNAPAWSFPLGTTSLTANAADRAGNASLPATASFTVTATGASICSLVRQWSSNDAIAASLCTKLARGDMTPFRNELRAQTGKSIPADKGAILMRLAGSL